MKKIITRFFTLGLLVSSISTYSQNVGINGTGAAPNADAMLDISSTNTGLLIPRVNIANLATAAPVTAPTTSLLVYNTNGTTGPGYFYWDGSAWVSMGGDDWKITGNAGTVAGTNFLGTTDNVDFSIRRNNIETMRTLATTTSFMDEIQTRDGGANSGDILVRIYDSSDDGIIDVYENNAMNIRLHGNGTTIFNDQGIASNDFRIESSGQANQFFVDAGNARIGIRNAAPAYMFEMTNGGINVGAAPMASYENTGTNGVALSAYNSGTTNGYNGFEGITAGTYSGVMGLGISTGAGADGVYGTTNDWQSIGVYGSRFNSGGANTGWGGLFANDLGYTGFFGAASDKRLKKDIISIENALDIINDLRPVTYHYDIEKYPLMGLNTELEYGFIAQEVKEVLPEIVREKLLPLNGADKMEPYSPKKRESEIFHTMDYTRLIPISVKAIKEQQAIIEAQNSKIEALEKAVKELQNQINK